MAKKSEDELKLKRFHIQNKRKVRCLCRFCTHALHLKLENAVHVPSGYAYSWAILQLSLISELHCKSIRNNSVATSAVEISVFGSRRKRAVTSK